MPSIFLSDLHHAKHFCMTLVCVLSLVGCAQNSVPASGSAGERPASSREQIARNGVVTNVRAIYLSEERAAQPAGSSARSLSQVGGAILGSLAGDTTEEHSGQTDGLEITVRLDNGEIRTITQQSDVSIKLNQRVQVISGSGVTRVVPN